MVIALKKLLHQMLEATDWIFSHPYCEACRAFITERSIICCECVTTIRPVVSCSLPITKSYDITIFALGAYEGVLRKLILGKHRGNRLASQQLGVLLCAHPALAHLSCDVLVPVPLHWWRGMRRGYNQAHEMAQVLASHMGTTVLPIVRRTRATGYQSRLHSDERVQNVKNAFSVRPSQYDQLTGKHVIIVDDLFTTGATVREVAKAIRVCKPASIAVLVAARAL